MITNTKFQPGITTVPDVRESLQIAPPQVLTTHSYSIKELASALTKVQSVLRGARKESENPFFKSKYADLHSVWETARGPLTSNGLCVIQTTEVQNGVIGIKTILAHTSGEWISGFLPLFAVKQDPQGVGSALTYMRRYAFSAIVGICTEDDDAEAATERSEYKMNIPKTKNFGKTLQEIGYAQVVADRNYWTSRVKTEGKPATGAVKDFLTHAEAFIKAYEATQSDPTEGLDLFQD